MSEEEKLRLKLAIEHVEKSCLYTKVDVQLLKDAFVILAKEILAKLIK